MHRQFKITVNGVDYQVAVEELSGQPAASAAAASAPVHSAPPASPVSRAPQTAAPAAAVSANDEVAQMGGVVATIYVRIGQSVGAGERLLDLEAMKMKVPLTSTRAGEVTRILVAEGEAVDAGQALVSIG